MKYQLNFPFRCIKSLVSKKQKSLAEQFPQYEFGKGTYGNNLLISDWGEGATLRIGSFCSIAADVRIFLGGEHRTDWVTTYPFTFLWNAADHIKGHPRTKGDVNVGNDVWIGREAVILSGVSIGDGAVVGARSVVTKNVSPYAVVAGNPARFVKKRFDDETISRLLRIKWWNWEDEEIEKSLPVLLSDNIEAFLDYAEKVNIKLSAK